MQQIRQALATLDRPETVLISRVVFYPRGAPAWKRQPLELRKDRGGYFETGLAETEGGLIRFHLSARSNSIDLADRCWVIAKAYFQQAAELIPAEPTPWLLDGVSDPVQRWLLYVHMKTNQELVTWSDWDEDEFEQWLHGDVIQEVKWSDGCFPVAPCYSVAQPLGALSALALDGIARQAPTEDAGSDVVAIGDGKKLPHSNETISIDARAVALLAQHPEWSNKQIAQAGGFNVKGLTRTRTPLFMKARDAQKTGRDERRRGNSYNGHVEAEDEG